METVETAPVAVRRPLGPEESGRADFYALLARLFSAAPDGPLLQAIALAAPIEGEGADPNLARAWAELSAASAVFEAEAAEEEYEKLFVGVGAALVSIHVGHYTGASSVDHPRVRIRQDLAALGLAPRESLTQPEDHFAVLFESMRVLAGGAPGRDPAAIEAQRAFFRAHLEPAYGAFAKAIVACDEANYYRKVAALALAFLDIEKQSFNLE
jgi:TorA maturation chaperone TorD